MEILQIGDVKGKIEKERGRVAESVKIVYKGKPVLDVDTVGGLGIKEGDFLVVMSTLKKP